MMTNKQKHALAELEAARPMRSLIQRLSLGPDSKNTRIITFIAARPHEGTSTIAREYAETLASVTNQKVLLIDAGPMVPERFRAFGIDPAEGIIDAMIDGKQPERAIRPIATNVSLGNWIGRDENQSLAGKVVYNPKFWESLLASFDSVIIDAPSLQASFDGVALAAKADATVIVVEAESTPQPVVHNLCNTLSSAGANLTGVVMNKRKYYIPKRVYRKL
jgi:protein-tyrosine kinase